MRSIMIGLTMGLIYVFLASARADVINITQPIHGGGTSGLIFQPPTCLPDIGLGGWIVIEHTRGIMQNLVNTDKGEMKVKMNFTADVWCDPRDEDQFIENRSQATHTGSGAVEFIEHLPLGTYDVPVSMTVELADANGNISPIAIPFDLHFDEGGGIGLGTSLSAITCL